MGGRGAGPARLVFHSTKLGERTFDWADVVSVRRQDSLTRFLLDSNAAYGEVSGAPTVQPTSTTGTLDVYLAGRDDGVAPFDGVGGILGNRIGASTAASTTTARINAPSTARR